jgi:hypothetical protein
MYSPKVIADPAERAVSVAHVAQQYSPECAAAITALAHVLPPQETAGLLALIGTVDNDACSATIDGYYEDLDKFFGLCGGMAPWARHLWRDATAEMCPKECRFCQAPTV